ncbi:MAG: glycosyltransferase [Deltaproteobacteria bacterium]|nr:glycosyltransferase [Deltaproteobacteria bacterium]
MAELRGRDIVCFSNDWDGDPLSKTHLMRILARDNRVLWVNSLGNRAPKANPHDAQRIVKKLGDALGGTHEVEPNLHVLGPVALPFFDAMSRAVNARLVRAQVLWAMRRLQFKSAISWSFLPSAAPVAGHLGEASVVYHCVDEFSAFSDAADEVRSMEADLVRRADLVITSAEKLRAAKAKLNPRTVLVRHGVDHAHFRKALDPSTLVPEDIASLPKPVIGFFGLLADWVDLGLVRAVADALPSASIVLIGKVTTDTRVLEGAPNIHLLGRKPYAQLPAYCKGWDLALMPFAENELTANANPLKVREYLAAGLPVVSTPVPEVVQLGLCKIASGPEAFVRAVREQLASGAGPGAARSAAISHESWEAKVDEIRAHVHAFARRGKT